jgi:hypothetical protein
MPWWAPLGGLIGAFAVVKGDGPSRLRAGRSVEAVYLWLSEPGSVEPSA